jgi:hypothetical protein
MGESHETNAEALMPRPRKRSSEQSDVAKRRGRDRASI